MNGSFALPVMQSTFQASLPPYRQRRVTPHLNQYFITIYSIATEPRQFYILPVRVLRGFSPAAIWGNGTNPLLGIR